ncbi:MAG TPA: hypothetical protein VF108_05285, partial [Actinomycetota bacterium]
PATETPPEPAVVQVPESDVVKTRSDEDWTASFAGPLARASRDQTPPPATSRTPRPADKQKRVRKPKPEKPAKQEPPKREPVKTQPTAASEPIEVPEPTPVSERRVAAMATTPASPPTAPTAPTAADRELAEAEAHEAALEMFIRLTESDRQPHDATEVDQGAVRAALARTAARKKPGGERLQPHEGPPGGSPGGPPRS